MHVNTLSRRADHWYGSFGFMDGISQPAVKGVDTSPNPGQDTVDQGVILCQREGDNTSRFRPSWAKDGSFLVLRYYRQLVPEFNIFLKTNPILERGLTPEQGSDLLGARLMGRWKSGAIISTSTFMCISLSVRAVFRCSGGHRTLPGRPCLGGGPDEEQQLQLH